MDRSSSYYCIVLKYESSLLTTFNTHKGRFCFVCLPFRLTSTQDIFQKIMDQILDHCEAIIRLTDDIIMHVKDDAEHNRRLHKFMKVTREHGLVLNKKKCEVKSNSCQVLWICLWQAWSPSRSIKCQHHQGDACPTEQRRALELPWNGNISLTIHPATIFSYSNSQRTSEDWCRTVGMLHIKLHLTSSNHWYVRT